MSEATERPWPPVDAGDDPAGRTGPVSHPATSGSVPASGAAPVDRSDPGIDDPAEAAGDAAMPGDRDASVARPGSLAEQVADWTPPWQRGTRSDVPPDEPVRDEPAPADITSAAPDPVPMAAGPRPAAEPDALPPAADLAGTLEAILLVCEEPVTEADLASALGRPESEIVDTLHRLAAEYTGDGRGFDLRKQAGGWRYYTRESFAGYVERFVLDGQQVRLTKAALETLAVVAYRQPVTRGRVSAIRGVNCDGVIRTLTTRGLIEECGAEPDSGAHLYRTTSLFLEKLGINSVAELPELAPFLPEDISELGESGET